LERQSPLCSAQTKRYEMGNITQSPDLSALIELVGFLVRHASVPSDHGNQLNPSTALGQEKLLLSVEAVRCLQLCDIIPKHMQCGGKSGQISKMVAHLCFENKQWTKGACKALLRIFNDYDIGKLAEYFDLLRELLTIRDAYQPLRFEWLVGYQQPLDRKQYGLATILDIIEEPFVYVSPIGQPFRDDPLFEQLWKHRHRQESFTVQCISLLFEMAMECLEFYEYLKAIPGPTYCYARYIDWMRGFLAIEPKAIGTAEKVEIATALAKARSLDTALQERLEKVAGVVQSPLYLIGKTLSEIELPDKQQQLQGVRLTFTLIRTEIYDSHPTGATNMALDSEYLARYFLPASC
jgi:hypothetical protein